jgi:acyl carrier protein
MEDTVSDRVAMIGVIVARIGKIAPVAPDADIFDAGFQSIDALELLLELEGTFGISIPDDDYVACRTVRQLSALVDRLGGGTGA